MFVSWCANKAGISTSIIPKFASCDVGMNWFRNTAGQTFQLGRSYGGGNYQPQKGDIIFFSSGKTLSDSDHVGIVTASDSSNVYTIEGNSSDQVIRRSYSLTKNTILGYGVPKYAKATASDVNLAPTYATISTFIDYYMIGDNIKFTYASDYATEYYIHISNVNTWEQIVKGSDMGDCYSGTQEFNISTLTNGAYEAYVTAKNQLGHVDSNHIRFSVRNSLPCTNTTITKKSSYDMFDIDVKNTDNGTVILAIYNGNKLVDIQSEEYSGENLSFATFADYTTVKIMLWDSISTMRPLYEPEIK